MEVYRFGPEKQHSIPLPPTLRGLVDLLGEDVVYKLAAAEYTQRAKMFVRHQLTQESTIPIQQLLDKWKPVAYLGTKHKELIAQITEEI